MTVLLVTCQEMPTGEPGGEHLVTACRARGIEATWVAWDDSSVDWNSGLVCLRSPWDYAARREEFVDWVRGVPWLLNSAEIFSWNLDKSYLVALSAYVATVPSMVIDSAGDLPEALQTVGTPAVLKPAVGVGGAGVSIVRDAEEAVAALSPPSGRWLAQPLLDSVRSEGEWSVFVLDGNVISAALKHAAPGEFRVHEHFGGHIEHVGLSAELSELATATVAAAEHLLGLRLDYARVDALRGPEGTLLVSELEVIEPGLYLNVIPENAEVFADLVASRLAVGRMDVS